MNDTFYKYGDFTFGIGTFGSGPSICIEDNMEQLVKNKVGQSVYTSLVEYGDVVMKQNPTIVSGDVTISIDGGSFSNITTLPTSNGYEVVVPLSQAETNGSKIQILFKDQTDPPEWNDKTINISTYVYDWFNSNGVDGFSTSAQVVNLQSSVNNIPTNNNGITVSASNLSEVYVDISSLATSAQVVSIENNILNQINTIAQQILSAGIDGTETVEDVLSKMLAYSTGNISRTNDVFTYYKQDNVTSAFATSASDTNRTRL